MSHQFTQLIKQSLFALAILLLAITSIQAAPSRCSYPKTDAGANSYYDAIYSWIYGESNLATASYLSSRSSEANVAATTIRSCGKTKIHEYSCGGKDSSRTCSEELPMKAEIAALNRLRDYGLHAYKRAYFLSQGSIRLLSSDSAHAPTSEYLDVSNCVSTQVLSYGGSDDWDVHFYIKCGNKQYHASIDCTNGEWWAYFDRDLCIIPSCTTIYPYTSKNGAQYDANKCEWTTNNYTYVGNCGNKTTCWKRIKIIPVNGTCNIPFSLNNRANIGYGHTGGINNPYSSGACCTGTNPYCGYTCLKPTCQPKVINGKTINWNILVSAND